MPTPRTRSSRFPASRLAMLALVLLALSCGEETGGSTASGGGGGGGGIGDGGSGGVDVVVDTSARVLAVTAADVLTLDTGETVLLSGARSPASGTRCAVDAAQRSAELVLDQIVGLDRCDEEAGIDEEEEVGPTVGYLVLGGQVLLAQQLIGEGWLTASDTRPCSEGVIGTYEALELDARAAGRGMHGPNCLEDPTDIGTVLIVASESSFDAPGQDLDNLEEEFVTLVSLGGHRDLTDWKLSDELGHVYRFPSFVLRSGRFVRVRTGAGIDDDDDLYWNLGVEAWNDLIGDLVRLSDDTGTQVDSFRIPSG